MYRVVFSPEARQDLQELHAYIAQRAGRRIASGYLGRLKQFCLGLGIGPHRGETRPALAPEYRSVGFERRCSVVFELAHTEQTGNIVGVLYGGQSLSASITPHSDEHDL